MFAGWLAGWILTTPFIFFLSDYAQKHDFISQSDNVGGGGGDSNNAASNNFTQKQYHMQQMTNSSLSQSYGLSQNEFSQDVLSLRSQSGGGGSGVAGGGGVGSSSILSQDSTYQGDRFSSQAQWRGGHRWEGKTDEKEEEVICGSYFSFHPSTAQTYEYFRPNAEDKEKKM